MTRYHLQKKEREIKDTKELQAIIKKGKYTTIALCRNNEPYIVTLSYGYDELKNDKYYKNLGILRLDIVEMNGKWGR